MPMPVKCSANCAIRMHSDGDFQELQVPVRESHNEDYDTWALMGGPPILEICMFKFFNSASGKGSPEVCPRLEDHLSKLACNLGRYRIGIGLRGQSYWKDGRMVSG